MLCSDFDDDLPPPLEDCSEQLEKIKISRDPIFAQSKQQAELPAFLRNNPASLSSSATSNSNSTSSNNATTVSVPASSSISFDTTKTVSSVQSSTSTNNSTTKSNSLATTKPKSTSSQSAGMFGGLRGGFFSSKPNTKPNAKPTTTSATKLSATTNTMQSESEEIPFIKSNPTAQSNLKLDDVQEAMKQKGIPSKR